MLHPLDPRAGFEEGAGGGEDVVLDVDGERVSIPFETIQKARLKGVVDFGKERGAV